MAKKKRPPPVTARRRAEIIMKVRSGFMTATEGAALLGVSRKTYYKWENRALEGMLKELEEKPPGRPETPEHEHHEAELKKRIKELEKDKQLLEKQMELKDLVHQVKLDDALQRQQAASRKGAKKKR
jgi:transposase